MSDALPYKTPVMKRYLLAKAARELFDPLLKDCYSLTAPHVETAFGQTYQPGAKGKASQLFDSQTRRSTVKRRNRVMGAMYPLGQTIIDFTLADVDIDSLAEQVKSQVEQGLRKIEIRVQSAIDASHFYLELPPAIFDSLNSTGVLLADRGNLRKPLRFQSVPISEIALEVSPWGTLETVFRRRQMKARFIDELWNGAGVTLPAKFKEVLEKEPDSTVEVIEAQLHVPERGAEAERWDYQVILPGFDEAVILQEKWKAKRLIPFRFDKMTGEALGRGPVTRCVEDGLTANKTVELTLKRGSIDVAGMWQADDDGVLNLANIKLEPGIVIPKAVGSAGLQPLSTGLGLNLSQIILADLHQAIKETIEGPPRPGYDQDRPVAYAFMSAERELAEVEVPEHQRLFFELDEPLGRAILDILSGDYFKGSRWHIDLTQLGKNADSAALMPTPSNPITKLREQAELQAAVEGVMTAAAINPEKTQLLVDSEALIRRFLTAKGLRLGKELRTVDQVAALEEQVKAQASQQSHAAAMLEGVQAGAELQGQLAGGSVSGAVDALKQMGQFDQMGGGA